MSKKSTPTVKTYIRYANDRRTLPTHLVVVRREIPGGPHRAAAVPLDGWEWDSSSARNPDGDDRRIRQIHSVANTIQVGEFNHSWRVIADYTDDRRVRVDADFLSSTYLHRRCMPIELTTEEVMRLSPALAQWGWPELGAQPVGNMVDFDKVPADLSV